MKGRPNPRPVLGADYRLSDVFKRANSAANAGTADTGQVWGNFQNTPGVINNEGYYGNTAGGQNCIAQTTINNILGVKKIVLNQNGGSDLVYYSFYTLWNIGSVKYIQLYINPDDPGIKVFSNDGAVSTEIGAWNSGTPLPAGTKIYFVTISLGVYRIYVDTGSGPTLRISVSETNGQDLTGIAWGCTNSNDPRVAQIYAKKSFGLV